MAYDLFLIFILPSHAISFWHARWDGSRRRQRLKSFLCHIACHICADGIRNKKKKLEYFSFQKGENDHEVYILIHIFFSQFSFVGFFVSVIYFLYLYFGCSCSLIMCLLLFLPLLLLLRVVWEYDLIDRCLSCFSYMNLKLFFWVRFLGIFLGRFLLRS